MMLTLCALAVSSVAAQKSNVDQAKKLAGKTDKIEEARSLIKQAIANPETSGEALTYYTAGKVEWDAYDNNAVKQQFNPEAVNPVEMADELLNGYNYYLQVFPLDQVPNEKGVVKPKYTKELQKKIAEKHNGFWEAGATYYGEKKYYPEAYNAFMIFGDMPDMELLGDKKPATVDTLRAVAYFNAGISAWSANEVDKAAIAFKKARENNYTTPEACVYEIACWQNIGQNDESREEEVKNHIFEAAKAGHEKFGLVQPVFLNNMVNCMINSGQDTEAMTLVSNEIAANPEIPSLYGLRAFIYDRSGNEEAAESDYRKAAAMPDVDYDTMRLAVRKLRSIGQNKWNEIELGDPDIQSKKQAVRDNYFIPAKEIAEKAQAIAQDPSEMASEIEDIDYMLTLK